MVIPWNERNSFPSFELRKRNDSCSNFEWRNSLKFGNTGNRTGGGNVHLTRTYEKYKNVFT